MKKWIYLQVALIAVAACNSSENIPKTTFQSSQPWRPTIDNRADAVMVYGVGGNPSDKENPRTLENRVKSWKDRGYQVQFMTGIAWGGYKDYFTGEWDGMPHLDEGQVRENGDTIWHGHMVPYIVPTGNYLKYMKEVHVKRAIDAGIDVIYFEEPEFWAFAGYSESFKREWEKFYGFPWRAQHESAENTYLSNKLKYHMYYNALKEVGTYAKQYGKSLSREIKCFVPTHSLVNYTAWKIVSPEASLASLDCIDGYIAQVWTGTSREPNYYGGERRERVFETAFLEYGCAKSMTAPTGRTVYFLTDPIEDWPRDWADYKKNYEATFTAQILYPDVNTYEIMPWPERIYEGLYCKSATDKEKIHIPSSYATQMQIMINALQRMPLSESRVSGTEGISVLMANSLMFQSFPQHEGYSDPGLSGFFGQALPLLKRGVPVGIVHMENLSFRKTLADTKVLLMSYSNMKPMDPEAHRQLARWVKRGGIIIYSSRDDDPYQNVLEWWNTGGNSYKCPADHLFSLMGIPEGASDGLYGYGRGSVRIIRKDSKEFALEDDSELISAVKDLYPGEITFKNSFVLDRGIYKIAAVLDESVSDEPLRLDGLYIDVYDPTLPVVRSKSVAPGTQALLIDMAKTDRSRPEVLASASRTYEEVFDGESYSYTAKSPVNTHNVSRVYLPFRPSSVTIDGAETFDEARWDEDSSTYLVEFENNPDGVAVTLAR
ncbi:MAG: hypothetical protein MJY62_00205 [Bacteroidales bacterium]|nr:hypothetical protein [Bacteroidales bacterium]